ncbi:uncharacterized protein TRIVIDRAFT_216805, partial [Trichoderma virens Gv29-8]
TPPKRQQCRPASEYVRPNVQTGHLRPILPKYVRKKRQVICNKYIHDGVLATRKLFSQLLLYLPIYPKDTARIGFS